MRIEIVVSDEPPKAVESTQSTAMPDEHRSQSRQAAPADDRLREWEKHGSHRWGVGVAVDLCDLESRVAALEKNHDAAPAATASVGSDRTDKPAPLPDVRRAGNPPSGEGTGDTHEPVAWAVMNPNDEVAVIAFKRRDADERASASDRVIPLYRSPTLTDAEREALEWAADVAESEEDGGRPTDTVDDCEYSAPLRGLLERTK